MSSPKPTDHLGEIYAHWINELSTIPEASTALLRFIFEDWQRATAEPEGVTYASTSIGGVPGILVTPLDSDPKQIQLFFHGGGFALGSSASHRKLAGHLAKACGCTAFVLDFRRAPEFKFPAQIEDGVNVYQALLDQGSRPQDITPVGDSAGGNLAISLVFALKQRGLPLPDPGHHHVALAQHGKHRRDHRNQQRHRLPHHPRRAPGQHRPLHPRRHLAHRPDGEPAIPGLRRAFRGCTSPPAMPSRCSTTACASTNWPPRPASMSPSP